MRVLRSWVSRVCGASLMQGPRDLWNKNLADSTLLLTPMQKAILGLYLAAQGWSRGEFPPRFEREATWSNECSYPANHSGRSVDEVFTLGNIKPYDYNSNEFEQHTVNVARIRAILRTCSIAPPARITELGCGQGWLSEMLAFMGFQVTGTSIAPGEIAEANRRAGTFTARGIPGSLKYAVAAMEHACDAVKEQDCVLVYQSMHHAYDWRATVASTAKILRPGGWFLICAEPNIAHTLIAYRVGKLTKTHEIGISRRQLKRQLRACGFGTVLSFASPLHFWLRWHWLAAQRTP